MTFEELARGLDLIVPADGLKEKLELAEKEKRPLIIKFGMDPTAPDLHLGHAVGLKKLRQFQEAGHMIYLLVGDYTTLIGDPSGRNSTRPVLTPEEIKANTQTYIAQMGKVIDISHHVKIVYNGEWLSKLTFADVIKLIGKLTLAQMLQRDEFQKRFKENIPIALHELIYPAIQGYDSVAIKADIELGGRDQLFNCLVGKTLQEAYGTHKVGQTVISMPLLRGLDGVIKMSKSKGNYIGLTEPPDAMFGKTMSIPDALIPEWADLTTDWTPAEKAAAAADFKNGTVNPMEIKKKIAWDIVRQYHSAEAADKAREFFHSQVQSRGFDTKSFADVRAADLGIQGAVSLVDLGVLLLQNQSKSAVRRLIESGAVLLNGEKATDVNAIVRPSAEPVKLKIGKRGFFNLIF